MRTSLLLVLTLSGCVGVVNLNQDLAATTDLIKKAHGLHGDVCAPVDLANAEADLAFAKVELGEGDAQRARAHATAAASSAKAAWASTESCGGKDVDSDGVPDVLDRCPNEAEDRDGDRDEDGCRDLDPAGDADRDGLRNIDDDCPDQAEDFDQDHDDDGCPETSEDVDGDGKIDAVDKCPQDAEDVDGFEDADGCPDDDNDNDNVADTRDTCPNAAEDIDDFEDADGCPDDDNDADLVPDVLDQCPTQAGTIDKKGCPANDADHDGVSDGNDKCPTEPETRNGYLDDDGCPDSQNLNAKITSSSISLPNPIQFLMGTSDFDGGAYAVLDDVARAMTDSPTLHVRVEAHTEGNGDESANQALSDKRAQAVVDYLVSRGVDASRLEAAGLGGTRPVDTNRTEAGRSANRRIEFVIVSR